MQCESVAWISARNGLQSTFLLLLCLLLYSRHRAERSWASYGWALGLFAMALLSKPTVLSAPLAAGQQAWLILGWNTPIH